MDRRFTRVQNRQYRQLRRLCYERLIHSVYALPQRLLSGSVLTIRTDSKSVFDEISAFYRNLRRLNLHEYEPQLARKTIVRPAQISHYSSNVRGRHLRGCPTRVGLTRRHVSVPWGVKAITNLSRHNAQRDKSLSYCRQRAHSVCRLVSAFGRPPRCSHFVNSTT